MSIATDLNLLTTWQHDLINQVEDARSNAPQSGASRKMGSGWSLFGQSNFITHRDLLARYGPKIPTVGGMSLGLGPDIMDQAERQLRGITTNWLLGGIFRPERLAHVRDRLNRHLEDKGYVAFDFGNAQGKSSNTVIPFYENPTIQESRNANYAQSVIMNRNEPYRLWTGAGAKQINLSFRMVLPHIMDFAIVKGSEDFNRSAAQQLHGIAGTQTEYFDVLEQQIVDLYGLDREELKDPKHVAYISSRDNSKNGFEITNTNPAPDRPSIGPNHTSWSLIKYISLAVDTIRSCVVGSVTKDYVQGAPVAYLNFGTLYKDYPCIVKSYTLDFSDADTGYDIDSMLPRVIKVTLNLEGFHQFEQNEMPGWDSILSIPESAPRT